MMADARTAVDQPAWGAFVPRGFGRVLLAFKSLGLSRGAVKKRLAQWWSRLGLPVPVDIRYGGLKFRIHPYDNAVENKLLFGSAQRDARELARVRDALAKGGAFLDIGANIGYYALSAARDGADVVLAFEPNPIVCERLRFNVDANGFTETIRVLPVALGDRTASMTLTMTGRDMGGGRIAAGGTRGDRSVEVQVRPLFEVLAEAGVTRIAAMKIDVEGMEDAVLFPFFEAGLRESWPRLIVIEHTSQDSWRRNILNWLKESGYREIERNRSNAMLERIDA